jgi:hypothetical protein
MKLILKQFLIIALSFLIILWYQYQDDKKSKRVRKTLYDKYKFAILVGSIIGLILNLPTLFAIGEKCVETLTDITIVTPVINQESCDIPNPFVHNNNFGTGVNKELSWFGNNKPLSDQQIFTDLPDF